MTKINKIIRKFGDRESVSLKFTKPSLTKQNFKDECDINRIVPKLAKGEYISPAIQGQFLDVTTYEDYQTSINTILNAQELFDSLPAELRKRFANDPAELLNFVHNPANQKEAEELGLTNKKVENSSPSNTASEFSSTNQASLDSSKNSSVATSDVKL